MVNQPTVFHRTCEVCSVQYIVIGTKNRKHLRLTCGHPNCLLVMKKRIAQKTWNEGRIHPKGFLGHKHSKESKLKMSEKSKAVWADPNSKVHTEEFKQKHSDSQSKIMVERLRRGVGNIHSKSKKSWEEIGGKRHFYRSTWEVVYARYLEFLKLNKQIEDWNYETKTFWFEKIRRGVRSFLPDFEVTNLNGTIEYHEVKGWMDQKSKTKLSRMKTYYPEIKVILIDESAYKEIKKWERMFPN